MGHRKKTVLKGKKLTPNTYIRNRKSLKTIIQAFTSRPQRNKINQQQSTGRKQQRKEQK